MTTSLSSSSLLESRKRPRTPNWREFYKNGLPKEVIVIDDDSPGPVASESQGQPRVWPVTRPQQASQSMADDGTARHANKKRKTAASKAATNLIYDERVSSSMTQTPHVNDSSSGGTLSTDGTASAYHTTAATSLGSHYSQNGFSNEPYADAELVGQKRKRTRKQAAEEAKQMEIKRQGDAYSQYHPPPNPPIKAKDVYVTVVHEVSSVGFPIDDGVASDRWLASAYEASKGR